MRSGQLSHTITLQRANSDARTDAGTPIVVWTDFAAIRAELVTHSIADTHMAYGEAAKASLVFRIRHFHGITTDDRLVYRGQAYAVTNLVELGRRLMELSCEVLK